MQQNDLFPDLLEKYLNNSLLPEEEPVFIAMLRGQQYRDWLSLDVLNKLEETHPQLKVLPGDASQRILQSILAKDAGAAKDKVRRMPLLRRYYPYAAAAVLIIAGAFYFFYTAQTKNNAIAIVTPAPVKNDVEPGGNKAVLTLADGSTVTLDSNGNRVISQGNTAVRQQKGQLTYVAGGNDTPAETFNTLTTPRGGQFKVTLPDGSMVWLNAASSLKFPTAFVNSQRTVELNGEAYFEVAQNAQKPFYVKMKDMTVQVLGTHFNVNGYDDEDAIRTTLLEGKVKVSAIGNRQSAVIKPGEQAAFTIADSRLTIADVDAEEAVAWKNGLFIFSNEPVESIMRKLERWYNIDVEYQGDVSGRSLWGTISRFEKVSEVLKMLELTNVVHFKIDGKKIVVKP